MYKRKICKDFQNISIVFYNYILMNYNIFPNKLKFESSIEGNKPVNFTIKEEKPQIEHFSTFFGKETNENI